MGRLVNRQGRQDIKEEVPRKAAVNGRSLLLFTTNGNMTLRWIRASTDVLEVYIVTILFDGYRKDGNGDSQARYQKFKGDTQ